jgi:hypothetical protein
MKQFITAMLLKLKSKYPDKESLIQSVLEEFDNNWKKNRAWVKKTGVLVNSISELFNRLDVNSKEDLFLKLLKEFFPKSVIEKHPKKRVWLCQVEGHKFFYDVINNIIVMPFQEEEPRNFPIGDFMENLPKLKAFLDYLGTYSMRNRRFKF